MVFVAVPIVKDKLNEAYELMTTHDMGCKYTSSQPGFLNMDVGVDTARNSVILVQKWVKKEDGVACEAKRKEENGYKAYNAILGPLIKGEQRFVAMDHIPGYVWEGETKLDAVDNYYFFVGEFSILPGKWNEIYDLSNTNELGNKFTAAQPGFLSMDIGVDATKTTSIFDLRFDTQENFWSYGGKRYAGASTTFKAFNDERDSLCNGGMIVYMLDRQISYKGAA